MESGATVTRSESLRKRPLEITSSSDGLPTKFKPGMSPSSVIDCTAQFRAQDVDEHFRRSLQSVQPATGAPSFAPVAVSKGRGTSSSKKRNSESGAHEPHQILITDTAHGQSTGSPSGQNVQFIMSSSPNIITTVPSDVPAVISALPGGFPQTMFFNLPPSSTGNNIEKTETTQVLSGPSLAAQKGGVMVPTLQGMIAPNLIPILDNSATITPQFLPAQPVTTAASGTPQIPGSSPPMFYVGPGGIPMLAQPGLVFMNPTDASKPATAAMPVVNQGSSGVAAAPTPNYIILPPAFSNFGLTLEQLASLSNLQQQQQQQQTQQKRQDAAASNKHTRVDLTSTDDRSSIGSSGSMEELPGAADVKSLASGVDSVEEHFARALGDQWHQVKNAGHHSNQSKIPA